GLGKHNYADITRIVGAGWDMQLRMLTDRFVLRAAATPEFTPRELKVLAAFVTDPAFQPLEPLLQTAWGAGLRLARQMPAAMLSDELFEAVAPGNPADLHAMSAGSAPHASDLERALRPALTGSPLEVSIVGDIDEVQAIDAVADSFGALPAR